MNKRPLLVFAAMAAATSPDMGRGALDRLKNGIRAGYAKDPMGTTVATVIGGAWLFYKAERGHNPKVKSYYDALVFISTNLSVGYSDIFAKTERGKAIASAIMTYGPAMTANLLNDPGTMTPPVPPPSPPVPGEPTQKDILDRLDRILAVLESNRDADRARAAHA